MRCTKNIREWAGWNYLCYTVVRNAPISPCRAVGDTSVVLMDLFCFYQCEYTHGEYIYIRKMLNYDRSLRPETCNIRVPVGAGLYWAVQY